MRCRYPAKLVVRDIETRHLAIRRTMSIVCVRRVVNIVVGDRGDAGRARSGGWAGVQVCGGDKRERGKAEGGR